jgi:hypothetical protein
MGKDMNVERKYLITKLWNECLETRNMGILHEFHKLSCAVTLPVLYLMHGVLKLVNVLLY